MVWVSTSWIVFSQPSSDWSTQLDLPVKEGSHEGLPRRLSAVAPVWHDVLMIIAVDTRSSLWGSGGGHSRGVLDVGGAGSGQGGT